MTYENYAPSSTVTVSAPTPPKTKTRRRRRIVSVGEPSVTVSTPNTSTPSAPVGPSYPTPAWGENYYKPRPGLARTLSQLRERIGDDRQTSYMLGDLLEARYGKFDDQRYNFFQKQADEYQHGLEMASIADQNDEPYTKPTYEIDHLPSGYGVNALMREMMQKLENGPQDTGHRDAIVQIYKDKIENVQKIQNDIREQEGRLGNYSRDFDNEVIERDARDENSAENREDREGNDLAPWYLPPSMWNDEQKEAYAAKRVGQAAKQGIQSVLGGLLPNPATGGGHSPEAGWMQKLMHTPVIGGAVPIIAGQVNDGDNPVNNFLNKIADETEDPVWWVLDKLTRPISAVNRSMNEVNSWDDDPGSPAWAMSAPVAGLIGHNMLESLDDVTPGGLKDLAGAWAGGIWGGGLGNSDNIMLGPEVIAEQAKRDKEHNIYDNPKYQQWAGLANDLLIDPLNYVGGGTVRSADELATTGIRASIKDTVNTRRAERTSEDIAKFLDETEQSPEFIGPEWKPDSKQILQILLGRSAHRPTSEAERIEFMNEGTNAVNRLETLLSTRVINKDASRHIAKLQLGLERARKHIINEGGNQAYLNELERLLQTKVLRGESATNDFDDVVTTAKVYGIIDQGMAYEQRYQKLLQERFGKYGKLNDKGKELPVTIDDVEKEYNNLVRRAQEGNIPRERVEAFRQEIDDFLEHQGVDKSIDDLLGTHWQAYATMSSEETRKALQQAMHLINTDPEARKIFGRIGATESSIRNTNKAKSEGKLVGDAYEKAMARHQRALTHAQEIRKQQYADMFVRVLKSHMLTKQGDNVYGNEEEAQALRQLLAEIDNRFRAESANTKNVTTIADRKFDDSVDQDTNYLIRNEQGKLEPDWTRLENDAEGFETYGSQLNFMRNRINEQLGRLGFDPATGRNAIEANRASIAEPPVGLLKDDGAIDRQKLHNSIRIDDFGSVVVNHTGNPEVDRWLDQVSDVIGAEYGDILQRKAGTARRRVRETRTDIKNKSVFEQTDPKIIEMFKGTIPKIDIDGWATTLADKEALASRITAGDRKSSDSMLKLIDELVTSDATGRHQAIGRLRDKLHEAGVPVPKSAKDVVRYITELDTDTGFMADLGNAGNISKLESVKARFSPEAVAFRRLFKEQHGMTVGQANIQRDRALGKVVMSNAQDWLKDFPNGLTRQEYKFNMLNSRESFKKVVTKSAFGRLGRMATAKSEKMARAENKGRVDEEWITKNYQKLVDLPPTQASKTLDKWFNEALAKQTVKPKVQPLAAAEQEAAKLELTKAEWKELREQSRQGAFDLVEREINKKTLKVPAGRTELPINPLSDTTDPSTIYKVLKYRLGHEQADLYYQRHLLKMGKDSESKARLVEIEGQIKELDKQKEQLRIQHVIMMGEAQKTKDELAVRIKEDAILRASALSLAGEKKQLAFNILGEKFAIPKTEKLFQAADRASGVPVIKAMREGYAAAFGSPSKSLNHDALRYARAQALGQAPIIIEHHIRTLQRTLGRFKMEDRKNAFKNIMRGTTDTDDPATQAALEAFSGDLLEAMSGRKIVGGENLSLEEINRYVSSELKISGKKLRSGVVIKTPQDIINATVKRTAKGKYRIKDPYEIAWKLRVAIEQAAARKAVQFTIKQNLGVRKVTSDSPAFGAIKQLPGLGWKETESLGHNTHYFPPQVMGDINRLMDMLEPHNLSDFGRLADKATGYWKTMTTVYNPGYWTRNGVGEMMSSWLAGLNNPRPYEKSYRVIRYWQGEGKDLAVLKEQFPWLKHEMDRTPKDSDVILYTKDGHKVTMEDLVVLYNDQGLKTGFFNTEFPEQFSKVETGVRGAVNKFTGKFRANKKAEPGTGLSDVHQKMRSAGEWYEDYLRMAHFVHAMEKHGGSIQSAAKKAAEEVRKYHFDYTDFTNFEKTVMLRAFPFYKWTRKALPLMLTMLFTKPGKIMTYPKIMNTISNTVSTGDIGDDPNGYAPNYEGIVPAWIQDLWAYQIAEYGDDDAFHQQNESYFNLATPQFDSYKTLTNPGNTAYGLLSPIAKVPDQITNMATGHSASEAVGEEPMYTGDGVGGALSTFAKNTPQTNFLQKILNGNLSGEDAATFGTGLGIYQSNEDDRIGELIRQGVLK